MTEDILRETRLFGRAHGHKSKGWHPFVREKDPVRIDNRTELSGGRITISTDGSAIHNGWGVPSAGVGV